MKFNRWMLLGTLVMGGALAGACGSDDDDTGDGSSGTGGGTAGTGGTAGSAGEGGTGGGTGGTAGSAGEGGTGGGTGGTAGEAGSAGEGGSAGGAGTAGAAGSAGSAGSGDAGVACDIQTGLTECDQCINTQCLTECNTCADNADCVAIWECIMNDCVSADGGASQNCAMGCVTANPGGLTDFQAFWQGLSPGCVATNCESECPS